MLLTLDPLNADHIKTEKVVPNKPENTEKIRYRVPMFLAFEVNKPLRGIILKKLIIVVNKNFFAN
jgi:hypothetical protein